MATRLRRAPGRDLELMRTAEERLTARLVSFFADTTRHVSRQISERLEREDISQKLVSYVFDNGSDGTGYEAKLENNYEQIDVGEKHSVHKSSDHPGGTNLHVNPQNAVPIYNIEIADAVTNANVLHVFVEMVREGKTQTRRAVVPMDSLIALQRVVDQTRVDKHERQLCETGETEPGQRPPLVLLWDGDNIIIGGHHGLQAARNLGVTEVEVDLLIAPE